MQPEIINNLNPCSPGSPWIGVLTWAVPIGSGFFLLATFLLTYMHNVNVRAGDLLLKLEDAFNKLGPKLAFLEYKVCCYEPVKGILQQCVDDSDQLQETERKTLEDMDQCIRFLYICTLHAGDKIFRLGEMSGWRRFFYPSRFVPQAYYYYLNRLNDETGRPELYCYIRTFFPIMRQWLDRNKEALTSYSN
jgi:hypothetical protein